MSQSKAREARQTIPMPTRTQEALAAVKLEQERLSETRERHQALKVEKAELKAEGKLNPARHLLSRLNYKKVAK